MTVSPTARYLEKNGDAVDASWRVSERCGKVGPAVGGAVSFS